MYTVKGEYYKNDINRSNFTKTFNSLEDIFKMLSDHVNGKYLGPTRGSSDEYYTNIHLDCCVRAYENKPTEVSLYKDIFWIEAYESCSGKTKLWIHMIESDRGIEYTDGEYTGWKKHRSKMIEEWFVNKSKEIYNKKFVFVD